MSGDDPRVPEDDGEALADELREVLEPLGPLPAAPTWLTTRLTAEFRRRRGELGPPREIELSVVSDTRASGLAGVRSMSLDRPEDYTIHLRSEAAVDAPEVVLDVRTGRDGLSIDGLVFRGAGLAYHVRTTAGELVRDADDTATDGRFSFRDLPAGHHRLVLDDGHDLLLADLDLSDGEGQP